MPEWSILLKIRSCPSSAQKTSSAFPFYSEQKPKSYKDLHGHVCSAQPFPMLPALTSFLSHSPTTPAPLHQQGPTAVPRTGRPPLTSELCTSDALQIVHGSLPHFFQVFTQRTSSQWGLLWSSYLQVQLLSPCIPYPPSRLTCAP